MFYFNKYEINHIVTDYGLRSILSENIESYPEVFQNMQEYINMGWEDELIELIADVEIAIEEIKRILEISSVVEIAKEVKKENIMSEINEWIKGAEE